MIVGIGGISAANGISPGTPWVPTQLSSRALWLDAADTSSVTLNGSNVSQWNDKSGNAKHAVQATASKQPAYTASLLNGRHGIVFNGSTTGLHIPSITLNTFTTIFIVLKNPSGGPFFMEQSLDANTNSGFYIYGNQTLSAFARRTVNTNSADFDTGVWTGTTDVLISINTVSAPSTAADIFRPFKNGSAISRTPVAGTTLANVAITDALNIGARNNGLSVFFNGNLYELIICDTSLNTADQQKTEGYLAWKWGLQGNLPSNHPYKNTSPSI